MKTDDYLGLNLQLLAKHKCLPWEEVLRLEEVQAKLEVSLEEMLLIDHHFGFWPLNWVGLTFGKEHGAASELTLPTVILWLP